MSAIEIVPADPCSPAARRLIAASDAYMGSLYPAESNHLEPPEALRSETARFLGAFDAGTLIGCGAVKFMHDDGDYGEIKRVFVVPERRGRGVSRLLMQELELLLVERGIVLARLETGIRQPEALGLYEKLGYRYREPFGRYAVDPLSVFMEKSLAC